MWVWHQFYWFKSLHLRTKFNAVRNRFFLICFLLFGCTILFAQETEKLEIPEPMMFDLVRGLGAEQGELEINTLADFPLNNTSIRPIEWAPEIEYALFDGFAVELEFPFADGHFEAFKYALQYTLGTSSNNKYIHGLQFIGETYVNGSITELSLLYIPAYRFNETWSALGLFGLMYELGADANLNKRTTVLLNATLFADIGHHSVLGLELNNSDPTLQLRDDNNMVLLVLPQFHYEFEFGFSFQIGFGPRFIESETEFSGVLRVIQTF